MRVPAGHPPHPAPTPWPSGLQIRAHTPHSPPGNAAQADPALYQAAHWGTDTSAALGGLTSLAPPGAVGLCFHPLLVVSVVPLRSQSKGPGRRQPVPAPTHSSITPQPWQVLLLQLWLAQQPPSTPSPRRLRMVVEVMCGHITAPQNSSCPQCCHPPRPARAHRGSTDLPATPVPPPVPKRGN